MIEIVAWAGRRLAVRVERVRPGGWSPLERARWGELVRANPRLFDGPMLGVESFEPARGSIVARRGWYRELVLAGAFDPRVLQLSVTGVIERARPDGAREVLMARRGLGTRIYPGLWEFVPAGGIEADTDFDERELVAQAAREMREETGLDLSLARAWDEGRARIACALLDHVANSLDLVLHARFEGPGSASAPACPTWECESLAWVEASPAGVGALEAIPPALPLARFLWPERSLPAKDRP